MIAVQASTKDEIPVVGLDLSHRHEVLTNDVLSCRKNAIPKHPAAIDARSVAKNNRLVRLAGGRHYVGSITRACLLTPITTARDEMSPGAVAVL